MTRPKWPLDRWMHVNAHGPRRGRRRGPRSYDPGCGASRGFTLVEALVAITITAMAGSVLLLGMTASIGTTDDALRGTVAQGLANQLLNEVLGARYMEYGCSPYDTTLKPGGSESATGTRELFDDIDDYNGWKASPPVDRWGVPLGTDAGDGDERHKNFFATGEPIERWTRTVHVYYVEESDFSKQLPSGQTSDYRAVEVRVYYTGPNSDTREMARARRVVAYVEPYEE